LTEIDAIRERFRSCNQSLPEGDFSGSVGIGFNLVEREPPLRAIKRLIARPALALMQGAVRRRLGVALPFDADLVALSERFGDDAARAYMLGRLPEERRLSVLIPGCYMGGEDVQFWLRRGVHRLEGIDVYGLDEHWKTIVPALRDRWHVPVAFQQGSIENIPFPDDEFDVMVSAAVLEHVRNIGAMVDETARVLRPGGFALHSFGPLYYCFGADHCIAAYGSEAGYDHLLLDEADYQSRIADKAHFKAATGNADLAFWALNDQFSFATAVDYISQFKRKLSIDYLVAKISPEGLAYRDAFPDKWRKLLDAGIGEADLLVKSISVVLRRPER
jgi:SAM-dependent methyltransferase